MFGPSARNSDRDTTSGPAVLILGDFNRCEAVSTVARRSVNAWDQLASAEIIEEMRDRPVSLGPV